MNRRYYIYQGTDQWVVAGPDHRAVTLGGMAKEDAQALADRQNAFLDAAEAAREAHRIQKAELNEKEGS